MEELDLVIIGKRSIHGVIALISRQFILQLISIGTFFLIASILRPAEIGIYTAVIAIQRIINFFTDFGLGAALVQKKDALTKEDTQTSFTMQVTITFAIFLIVFLLREQIAAYFNLNTQGIRLLLVLVFSIFLSSFKTIPSILLERAINFSKLIIPQIVESLVFNVVLVVLVLQGYGIDSYSWAFLLSSLIGIPAYYFVSPWKIGLGINRAALQHLKFGAQFQAKNIIATIKDDLLTVVLVRILSFTEIGYIGFAQRLAFMVYRTVVDSVTKVTFSTYSRLQENTAILKKAIEKSLFFVSSAMFPVLTGLIILSPYLIGYFPKWQNKWEPAIISIIFFCLNAMVSSASGILVNILDSTGKVKTTLKLMVIWTFLTWILTPIFIYMFGYNGVAIASFVVTLTIFYTIYLVKQIVAFSFFGSIKKPFICTIGMGIIIYVLSGFIISDLLTLGVVVVIGGITYLTFFYAIAKEDVHEAIRLIKSKHEK